MHVCTLKRFQWLPLWGVFFVWLFLGGVALAEQVDLMNETSAQDEQALDTLELAIKPGQIATAADPIPINRVESIAEVAGVSFLVSRFRLDESRSLLNAKSSISLFMILSCYRI